MKLSTLGIKKRYHLVPEHLRKKAGKKKLSKKNLATMCLAIVGASSIALYALSTTSTPTIRNNHNESYATGRNIPGFIPSEPDISDDGPPAVKMNISSTNWDNRLIIEKIGVNISLVEGENEDVLRHGAWRSPWGSAPDAGGNTVIFGHRYGYLPPDPRTFYLLDKVVVGDSFKITWQGKEYSYRIIETKVVAPTEISSLLQTDNSVVTLITCTPVFTTQNRLIVRGELVN